MSYLSSLKGIMISEDQLIFYYRALKPLFNGLRGLFSSWHLSQCQLMGSLPTRSYQTKLKQCFEALSPTVNELLGISGTAGASVGILHSDEVVCIVDIGYRDVDKKTPLNQDTLYYIASLSKFMTAAGIGQLVEDGKLKWTNLVASALPEFQHCDPHIHNHATIVDILSHRTGLAQKMHVWMGEHSQPQVTGYDFTRDMCPQAISMLLELRLQSLSGPPKALISLPQSSPLLYNF